MAAAGIREAGMASEALRIFTFRIGDPPAPGGGLRIGVTRRPPRGVARERWVAEGLFDVWLPAVAPSAALLARFRPQIASGADLAPLFAAYERELLGSADGRQLVELLAVLARRMPVGLGCYCEDESRCHRKRLRRLVERAAGA
jgi:uncharacterized protein YeaO (DUF488 family)